MIDLTTIVINQALKDENNLEVAFETWKAFSSNKIFIRIREQFENKLIEMIKDELINSFPELKSSLVIDIKSNSFKINIDAIIQLDGWDRQFRFGIYDDDNDRLYFSVKCIDENEEIRKRVHTEMKKLFNEGNILPHHWWCRSKEPYNRWESNQEGIKQFAFCNEIALNYFCSKFCSFVYLVDEKLRNFG